MHYFGGKARVAHRIAEYINNIRKPGQVYWEPFVGGAWIMHKIADSGPRIASDVCGPLIAMYQSLQAGWVPPTNVDELDYMLAKLGVCLPATQAFIGFGCSFAGKWFGGFARGGHGADAKTASSSLARKMQRNYAVNASSSSSLHRKSTGMSNVRFEHWDYRAAPPIRGALIYCDPPYSGTTGYAAAPRYDHNDFWAWCDDQSKHNTVLVSEYTAPAHWIPVLQIPTRTDIRNAKGELEKRTEKVFCNMAGLL